MFSSGPAATGGVASGGILGRVEFGATIQLEGRSATGFRVPGEVVAASGGCQEDEHVVRDSRPGLAGSPGRRTLAVGLAILLAGAAVAASAPPTARAAGYVFETAATTYELVPEEGVLEVTIDLSVTDFGAGGHSTSHVWMETAARNIRMIADRGLVSRAVEQRVEGFVAYRLTFQPVEPGQARTIRVTYQLPGGSPRSANPTRVGGAYAAFCVFAHGLDGGSVQVVVPDSFGMDVWPGQMTVFPSGDRVVYASGTIADTTTFYRCLEGTNEDGFRRSTVTSPSGRTVVIEGWPEDAAWQAAVGAEVGSAVDSLEELVGRGLPGTRSIRVREVSNSELGYYAGIFDPDTGVARISETYTEPGVVAHELSHAWFNLNAFATRWMSEGLAQWAERVSPTAGPACAEPAADPAKGAVDLDEWAWLGPRSSSAERERVQFQYDASCWIVTALGARMGADRMSDVIEALLDQGAAYGDEPSDRRPDSGPIDWKTFLDLVDEVGLAPAGVADLEFAQDLLLRYSVAEPGALAGRAEARVAYHALAADLGDWAVPDAIRAPLERWEFDAAQARMATAEEVLDQARQAEAALAGIDALDGPVRAAFEEANDAEQLARARDLAAAQAAAAKDVARALDALDEPRDTIEEIGLMGAELRPVADAAVAAVRAADADAATAAADRIRDQLARASETGAQRVALATGGALVVLLLIVGAVVMVRRRRRRLVPAAVSVLGVGPAVEAVDVDLHRVALDGWGGSDAVTHAQTPAPTADDPTAIRPPELGG